MSPIKRMPLLVCVLLLAALPPVVMGHPANAPSGTGTLGTWQTTSSMTIGRQWSGAVIAGSYIYVLGGRGPTNSPMNSVERALINPDGSLGTWQSTTPMARVRSILAAVHVNGRVYALGGDGGSESSSVERASINADSSLNTWEAVSSMTMDRVALAAVAANGYLYAIGGLYGYATMTTNTVERAAVNSDGSLGPWQITSPMTTARGYHAAAVVGNYIYAIGGQNQSQGAAGLKTVERAEINADGSLGTWQPVNSMNTARCNVAGAALRGYVYAIGGAGCAMPSPVYSTVEQAKVNPDGSLGPWEFASSMTTPRERFAAVQNGDYIYALEGDGGNSEVLNSVERVGQISLLFLPMAIR